jgi:2-(1,2-epoxy-1,2-dihydrophenyl)acetyl-CoA isomerase
MPDCLIEKRDDGVALITLNRPESLNAMGGDLVPLLVEYLADCASDPAVRCVALTGAGRAFCAGGDVRNMQRRNDGQPVANEPQATANVALTLQAQTDDLRWRQAGTSLRLHTMPKPTVALVNGHAVGAGLGLALACDLRIASARAKFGTAFRNVGLSGDFGSSYFLPRLVGMGKARELFFTAEVIDAPTALALGIVNRVIEGDDWLDEALAFCARLASGPTAAYGRMKANLNLAETARLGDVLDQEALHQRISGLTEDSREAVRAFLEKREPNFLGR